MSNGRPKQCRIRTRFAVQCHRSSRSPRCRLIDYAFSDQWQSKRANNHDSGKGLKNLQTNYYKKVYLIYYYDL